MTRWLSLTFGLILMVSATVSHGRSLTVSFPDWPPFYIHDASRPTEQGLAREILGICAEEVDKTANFDMYPIRRMFKYMERGDLDLNIMSFKPDRLATLDFGKELVFENSYVVWTRRSLNKRITSIQDLDSLTIGQLVGLRPSDPFKLWFENRLKTQPDKETLVVNSPEQLLKMLASERIDVTVASQAEFKWRGKKLGLTSKIKNSGFVIKSQDYFLVMSKASPLYKQNPQLLNTLDQCVRKLKITGKWAKLREHYDL
jgi:ABC-type amino acid transport substrate-binding protein